jgi:hypothetical protein
MSIHSRLEIAYGEGPCPIDLDEIADEILKIFKAETLDDVLLNNFRDAFEVGGAALPVPGDITLEVVERIASLCPETTLFARFCGEDFRETWIREFEGGKATFAVGPWTE